MTVRRFADAGFDINKRAKSSTSIQPQVSSPEKKNNIKMTGYLSEICSQSKWNVTGCCCAIRFRVTVLLSLDPVVAMCIGSTVQCSVEAGVCVRHTHHRDEKGNCKNARLTLDRPAKCTSRKVRPLPLKGS